MCEKHSAQILDFLGGLKRRTDTSIVLITHDLGVAAELCDRVIVMYAGRIVESGAIDDIFSRPQHPYTQALLRATPSLDGDPNHDLPVIPGWPPDMQRLPAGCAFAPRCEQVFDSCHQDRPALQTRFNNHLAACHREQRR